MFESGNDVAWMIDGFVIDGDVEVCAANAVC